jgi:transmembrane sensor
LINIENIDELISKFLSGEASPEEAMLLEDWKNDRPENLLYYSGSEQLFSFMLGEKTAQAPDSKQVWEKLKIKIDKGNKGGNVVAIRNTRFYTLLAAASIILLIAFGIFAHFFKGEDQQEIVYSTGKDEKKIKLPDGTAIAISPNSSLVVGKDFGRKNRTLHLKGAADFTVIHQETLPFIVDVGEVFIKDIGTKFSIRSSVDTDTVYIRVNEGVVLLFDSLGSSLEIKATEKALYIRSLKRIITEDEIKNANTNLQFVNASLEEVILKLTAMYKTSIALERASLKNCTITTQFNKEDLETVLGIITETLGLSYEKTPSGYLIKGQSCQSQ